MLAALGLLAVAYRSPIDAVLDRPAFRTAIVGALVTEMDGKVLFQRNADMLLIPASNQKILSVAFALHTLGPDYAPVTRFWKNDDGLYVDTPGDPSMTYEKLRTARLFWSGEGGYRVFVKQGFRPGHGPGWEWDDLPNRYAPGITALSMERNGFELWGNKEKLWIEPPVSGIKIERKSSKTRSQRFDYWNKKITYWGPLPEKEGMIEAFALPSPDSMAAQVLGGSIYPTESVPDDMEPTYTITGEPMSVMAGKCLQPSDNFHAESLMFMAATKEGPLGEGQFATAASRMRKFLTETVGLLPDEVDPYDGSGLSRHNNVSAWGVNKVLRWARTQPWGELWVKSMAGPGVGTLRTRLAGSTFMGKTGTLNKVASLSGYCKTKDGRELVVSLIFNHFTTGPAAVRNAQDEIIRLLESTGDANGAKLAGAFGNDRLVSFTQHSSAHGHWVR